MLFRRRNPPHWVERLRVAMWPRHSWARSARYFLKRTLRLTASPHVVATGFAAGVFASFTPFVGFHFIIGFVVAFLIGGNLLASALGTSIGNPLTFPFIWASTYEVGQWILPSDQTEMRPSDLARGPDSYSFDGLVTWLETFFPIIKPMLVGAAPLGTAAALVAYFVIRMTVYSYQERRKEKVQARAATATTGHLSAARSGKGAPADNGGAGRPADAEYGQPGQGRKGQRQ